MKTQIGWVLQGPPEFLLYQPCPLGCLFISIITSSSELMDNVAKLWQMDVLPYRSEKLLTLSAQDKDVVRMLEEEIVQVGVNELHRYPTHFFGEKISPTFPST